MVSPVAGLLLGKTSLNSLYGLKNVRRELCHSLAILIRPLRVKGLRRRRTIKLLRFFGLTSGTGGRRAGLLEGITQHAKRVGRPPRPVETASRNHGGAGQRPGATGQD